MSSQPKPDRSGGLQRTQAPPNVENEALHAERRQLTVAFVDIVGSTPLSERIDPEEFFAVIRTYRDICDEQISRYGGHIARMIGDGLLAYFGVPQAHENDPERAVRASLAVAAAIKEHKFLLSDGSFVRLGVRIGVNTGVVVVGSVPGEPLDRREVFGSSAHVAARQRKWCRGRFEHLRVDARHIQLRAAWQAAAQGRGGAGRSLACGSSRAQRKQVR
jgi:class 3 adenylate cyclase